jgi:hypothetical protein
MGESFIWIMHALCSAHSPPGQNFFFNKEGYPDNDHSVGFFSRGYERVLLWNLENDVFLRTAQGMTRVRSIKMESMGEAEVTECKLHFGKLILQGLLIHSAGFVFDRAKKLHGSVRTTCSFSSVSLLTSQGCVPVLS